MRDFLWSLIAAGALMNWGVLTHAFMRPRGVPIDRIDLMSDGIGGLVFCAVLALAFWGWCKVRP